MRNKVISREQLTLIKMLIAKGYNYTQIANYLKTSRQLVSYYARKHNLKKQPINGKIVEDILTEAEKTIDLKSI